MLLCAAKGGQTERFTDLLNVTAAEFGLKLSEGGTRALLEAASVKQLGVLHNYDPPRIGKHFCSAEVVTFDSINFLFSACIAAISADQKGNMKVNSDHNSNMVGGNSKAGIFQVVHERVMTYSHGAGGDYLAKFGLFSMLMSAVRLGAIREELRNFNLSDFLPSYNHTKHFMEKPGLAVCLGHCQVSNKFVRSSTVSTLTSTLTNPIVFTGTRAGERLPRFC